MSANTMYQRRRLRRNDLPPDSVPPWQVDEEATVCYICHRPFTFLFRRHHCRKCGKVVCGYCSDNKSTYLPSTYVVCPPSQIFLESPHVPHRTCDVCMEELNMVRAALRGGTAEAERSGSSRRSPSSRFAGGIYDQTLIQDAYGCGGSGADRASVDEDDSSRCPICGKKLSALDEARQQAHILKCIEQAEFSGSPNQKRLNNRMIVDVLKDESHLISAGGAECLICFEDFQLGEKIGRLECLCVYHERCILDWFARKGVGSCPVHAINH
ncbi:E3 ubiquitin-protein ligase Pib1p [Trichomonascus vanleenenianus]|uniref:phosphatidylinositol-3-phosphate-binding ubiquitin-protein ligase n=1 Tax=Trichomonascus vanleenenianus TaxID=2268995 RepID=UPI003EC9D478